MGTKEKLTVAKEIIATIFVSATERATTSGMKFKYSSYPVDVDGKKGWKFEVIVAQAGYQPRTVQEFSFQRPENIDAKNMEYNVILHVLTEVTQTALLSWYQLGIMLNVDEELRTEAKNL
jgi:hypothetical protein|tara:strand:+ start:333 stop:692 length:360 start_codon:yes stop_codon:yes gene_type:complete